MLSSMTRHLGDDGFSKALVDFVHDAWPGLELYGQLCMCVVYVVINGLATSMNR